MSYWEEKRHNDRFNKYILLIRERKSRRSPSDFASFGIRASALDSQKDVDVRRRQRYERYENFAEETCKILEEILQEENRKKIEREKEEKELEEKEEQEQDSQEIFISNDVSSSLVELNLQELEDEIPKESTFNKLTNMRKNIDIIPSAPLFTQPSFGSQNHENYEGVHMEFHGWSQTKNISNYDFCFVKNINENHNNIGDDFYIFEEENLNGHFHDIKEEYKKDASIHKEERSIHEFVRFVFDPGGQAN